MDQPGIDPHADRPTAAEFQKLVRCNLIGPDGEQGARYTALEYFSLWEYMMRTHHKFECRDYAISLWVPADEFERQRTLYEHSGEVEAVDRFDFTLFDDVNHYTYAAARFVLHADNERFRAAMLSHLPQDVRKSDRFALNVTAGHCIEKERVPNREHLVLGLYNQFQDIY